MKRIYNAVKSIFTYGAPPRPEKIVQAEMDSLGMSLGDVYKIFKVFMRLKGKTPRVIEGRLAGPYEIQSDLLNSLIKHRKSEIEPLLGSLLLMAGASNTIQWDSFFYLCMRFGSMSKLELSQLMFFVIVKTIKSWTLHYITNSQLAAFYSNYRESSNMSFNTRGIDFGQLPLSRYYMSDFVELCMKHPQLLNPLVHLQRTFHERLPDLRFWDKIDRIVSSNRRVTLDFFLLQKTRIFMEGEYFKEALDSLIPETLGKTQTRTAASRSASVDFLARSRDTREKDVSPFTSIYTSHKAPLLN